MESEALGRVRGCPSLFPDSWAEASAALACGLWEAAETPDFCPKFADLSPCGLSLIITGEDLGEHRGSGLSPERSGEPGKVAGREGTGPDLLFRGDLLATPGDWIGGEEARGQEVRWGLSGGMERREVGSSKGTGVPTNTDPSPWAAN